MFLGMLEIEINSRYGKSMKINVKELSDNRIVDRGPKCILICQELANNQILNQML